ncbi:Pc21g09660 [Penicillium rubens Wisconsin 54-1255]|jgi:ABC-type multidrug transport system permease subunit|uniref:Pc21g09660 protein n=1 Tax=Penicillium rubens (strain ATCC 28089 / DSM 1075 / NRRL 1951 / Wisconsin 54-1255) TaxID=500485 RepID=B6HNP8_PENRW|nr:Pc21g09660 [Penicillium rubens Wisconsin 54-1255]
MAAIRIVHHTKSASVSLHSIVERSGHKGNWANRNRGVVLVFVIVFIVVVGIIALLAYRRWLKRKADKESYETTHD